MLSLGIDLTASPKKSSAYAVLNDRGEFCSMGSFRTFDELLEAMDGQKPSLIAIDAPLTLPLGLDCLEESCPCSAVMNPKGRLAEVALAHMGIGLFFTTKRSIIKSLVYRGMEFYRDLTGRGHQVIEIYPYATKVVLFGSKIPRKSSPEGIAFLRGKLSGLIPGLDPLIDNLNHDDCDALLAAYTGYCHLKDESDSLGNPEEGCMVIPKLPN